MTGPHELVEDPAAEEREPVRGRWARRLVAGAVAVGLIAGGVGTAAFTLNNADDAVAAPAGPGPRKLTDDEAYRASVMRYQNFRTGGMHVRATLPGSKGRVLVVGDVDVRGKVGFAKVTNGGQISGVYQWTPRKVVSWPSSGPGVRRPAKVPAAKEPRERALQPLKYQLDAVFAMLLQFGAARPDKAANLQRTATFMRVEGIDGLAVDVVRGARRADGRVLDYWVDTNGRLQRVTTRLTAAPGVTQIDLSPGKYRKFVRAEQLAKKPKAGAS
jgi:hypothetical protein